MAGKGSSYSERSKIAQRAGFRNYSHYRKVAAHPKVRRMLEASKVRAGKVRYELAALAANSTKYNVKDGTKTVLPSDPKKRDKVAGVLSDAIRRAGGNPTRFWGPLGSPKRGKF